MKNQYKRIPRVWIHLFLGFIIGASLILSSTSIKGFALPGSAQSPILGVWNGYRIDDVDNFGSAIAYNSVRDEYLVVWEDHYSSDVDLFAQRVASDGTKIGDAIPIDVFATYNSWQASVAYSPSQDKYLVVYSTNCILISPPDTNYMIVGHPINGDGTITEPYFPIAETTDNQRHPAVAYNPAADEFLVTWDEEQGLGGLLDIWAQRINASDWSKEIGPVCIATGSFDRFQPDVAYNEAHNQYLIAYTRVEGDNDIFAKLLDAVLTDPLSVSEFAIIYNTNLQDDIALAAGRDEYMAVWQDGPSSSWRTIYARRVAGDGSMPDPPFLIIEHTGEICAGPDIAFGHGFGYLVAWSYEGSVSTDTYGRNIMPGGIAPAGDEFPIDPGSGTQKEPAIACAPNGDCLFTESDNSGGADYEIYGRTIRPYHSYLPLLVMY